MPRLRRHLIFCVDGLIFQLIWALRGWVFQYSRVWIYRFYGDDAIFSEVIPHINCIVFG